MGDSWTETQRGASPYSRLAQTELSTTPPFNLPMLAAAPAARVEAIRQAHPGAAPLFDNEWAFVSVLDSGERKNRQKGQQAAADVS